jgi:hypothetical protein
MTGSGRTQRFGDPRWYSRIRRHACPAKNLFDYLERGYDLDEFSMLFRQCRGNRPLRFLKTLTRS